MNSPDAAAPPPTTHRSPRKRDGGRATDDAVELARVAARAADDKSATDVAILDVTAILSICEIFLICSARNPRLVAAVSQEIEDAVAIELGRRPISVEGLDDRRWVLLDYGDTVIHVFLDDEREVYRLDRLYADAPDVDWQPAESTAGGNDTAE